MDSGNGRHRIGRALAALILGAFSLAAIAGECVRTVRWNNDRPYSYRNDDGVIRGIYADLMREVLQRMGCQTRFVELPWARALVELESGQLDVLPGAFKTPERERFAHFSRPINRSPNVIFLSKAAAARYRINRLSDLIGTDFRLGAMIKVSYGVEFETLIKNPEFVARIETVTHRRGGWQMIDANRIDGMIADEITGLIELDEMKLSATVVNSRVVVSGDPAMVALSKHTTTPEFVRRFNRTFGDMLNDGSYRKIFESHVPCTAEPRKLGCK